MQVKAYIRRMDLLRFNMHMLFRMRANLIFIAFVFIGVFVFFSVTDTPRGWISWSILAVTSVLAGVMGLLAGFAVSLLWVLFSANEKNGTLGTHVFTLSEQGFHESTRVNEGLQKWPGVQSLHKSGSGIYVQINAFMFHVIPRRSFGAQQEFEKFWDTAHAYWKQSASTLAPGDGVASASS